MRSYFLLIAVVIGTVLSACKSNQGFSKKDAVSPAIIYPLPPDTARIQFLTAISSSADVVKERSAFYTFVAGNEEVKTIQKPYGVHLHKGKMYVCDIKQKGIVIIDLAAKNFELFAPAGIGALRLPIKCFVDKDDNLFVADGERKQIVVFDKDLNYKISFGLPENFKPSDVFIENNTIWVVNNLQNCIHAFDASNYKLIKTLPEPDIEDAGKVYKPTSIWVRDNTLYVSDFGDFKIKAYSTDGKFLQEIGSYGKALGQFVRPKGVAVDKLQNIYVVDAGFENVQLFNNQGKLLMYFGGPYKGKGDMYLPSQICIDYENLDYFKKYVSSSYKLKYLVLVSNQFGPDKINVYGAIEPNP